MFSSNSLDKNCVGSDNCSSGRNNPIRFPVGMTSLGDENQQIRIQLAVHKYNSTANSQLNNKTSVVSPIRHSFLKNSLRAKNIKGELERMSKNEKKNENEYEGVGAFPTIHLKKSAVRYRPIRRFHDVKIPYPELPVSRFLSHLPEVNSDLKSSARSVLDVLEDLSGKKIHSNEDNRTKLKGLGGDYLSNPNAVYKPLFVQKPKIGSILTRDNATQTLTPADADIPSPQSSNSFKRNDASDPRAELRRKLAKQNNEIFASLSSSISSPFAMKRKIDKILPSRDDRHMTEGSVSKKSKMSDQYKNCTDNSDSRTSKSNSKLNDSKILNRKNKINELSSPSSPNKDRLTTIFLDTRNTSPKAQIFEKNSVDSSSKKPIENGLEPKTNLSNGFAPSVNAFGGESKSPVDSGTNNTENDCKNTSVSVIQKVDPPDGKNEESEQKSKPMFNFPINTSSPAQNHVIKTAPTGFQFSSNGSNFSFQKTTPSEIPTNTGIASNSESKDNNVQSSPFTSGSSNVKPDFSSFKFGAEAKASPLKDTEPSKPQTSEPLPVITTTALNITPPFSFGTTSTVTTTASLSSVVNVGSIVSQNTTAPKPMFTFGQTASPNQPSVETVKAEEKVKNIVSTPSAATNQNIQSTTFSFEQKTTESSTEIPKQNVASSSTLTSQYNINTSATTISTDSATATQNGKSLFTFGQKPETPATSASITTNQEQKFGFLFEQKPDTGQDKVEGFGQKSSNLFFFGQKSTTQESTQNTTVTTNVTSPSQVSTTQPTLVFGSQTAFVQSPATQPTVPGAKSELGSLGSVTAPASTQNSTDFSVKTPLFTAPGSGFGSATTQTSNGFATTTSTVTGFKFGAASTTQAAPTFGVSSASQTKPVFGASTSQSISGFGSSTTTQSSGTFGAPTSNPTPGFGVSRQPSFTFGLSSTTQTTPSFGTSTSQATPAFGTSPASQPTPSFGIPSTTQSSSAFGSSTSLSTSGFGTTSTTQSTSAFGGSPAFGAPSSQPNSAFGVPASSQSGLQFGTSSVQNNTSFGAPAGFSTASSTLPNSTFEASTTTSTSGFGTSQSSFSQPFGSKTPATSPGQTTGIFGQNTMPSFSSNTGFSSNQNNVFEQKPSTGGNIFDQSNMQAPGFGATNQPFGTQNKFSFGMSTSNATGFTTTTLPNTTAAPVFSFGGNSSGNTFTFGSSSSGSTNTQTPFAFKSPTNEPFKFGATATKEGPGFGGASTSTFTFGGQMNNNPIAEQKPAFNFGNPQVSSSSPFTFGTTPSPSVFSFGGSTSSASSGSSFNFGTPTPNGPFGQAPTGSSGARFAVPGTFSIGSGSSQSRPRATSRPRRRP